MAYSKTFLCYIPLWIVFVGCSTSFVEDKSSQSAMDIPSPNLPGAPLIPERSVVRPYVKTSNGEIPVGESVATAFAVTIEENQKPIVLSALSVLDTGKFFTGRPAQNSFNLGLESITLSDAFGSMDGVVSAFAFIDIPESGFADDSNAKAGDVLAIQLGNKNPFKSFRLSDSLPTVGEKIWLSAAVFEGAPPSQRQHEAVLTQVEVNGNIQYRFENKKLSFQGTLGAPILNAEGKVIAIHLGAIDPADPLLAKGNPAARFLPYLTSALNKDTSQQAVPAE
jgi:hypothetical protein